MSADRQNPEVHGQDASKKRLALIIVHTWAPRAATHNYREQCSLAFGPDVEVREVRVTGFAAVTQAAKDGVQAGAWALVSVGGDGTVNAVVNGMIGSSARLFVLPGGTSNDVSYHLGQSNDPAAVAPQLATFEPVEIDALRVNAERRFCLAASMGFFAEMFSFMNRLRSRGGFVKKFVQSFGNFAYLLAMCWCLINHRKMGGPIKIKYRDLHDKTMKTCEIDAFCFVISNPSSGGRGEYPFLSYSSLTDGKFELTIWSRAVTGRLLDFLGGLRNGKGYSMEGTVNFQTDYCEIECSRPMECYLDGDPILGFEAGRTSYQFDIEPLAIHLMAPKGVTPGARKSSDKPV